MSAPTMVTEREAVMARVIVDDAGCWLWQRAKLDNGYGAMRFRGRQWKAHRVAYTVFRGEIPDGLVMDHLCHVRACVNPEHLEPVTVTENARRRDQSYKRPRPSKSPEDTRLARSATAKRYRARHREDVLARQRAAAVRNRDKEITRKRAYRARMKEAA